MEPLIEPGNEAIVHHATIYACWNVTMEHVRNQNKTGGVCFTDEMPEFLNSCRKIIHAWAVGGSVSLTFQTWMHFRYIKHKWTSCKLLWMVAPTVVYNNYRSMTEFRNSKRHPTLRPNILFPVVLLSWRSRFRSGGGRLSRIFHVGDALWQSSKPERLVTSLHFLVTMSKFKNSSKVLKERFTNSSRTLQELFNDSLIILPEFSWPWNRQSSIMQSFLFHLILTINYIHFQVW